MTREQAGIEVHILRWDHSSRKFNSNKELNWSAFAFFLFEIIRNKSESIQGKNKSNATDAFKKF